MDVVGRRHRAGNYLDKTVGQLTRQPEEVTIHALALITGGPNSGALGGKEMAHSGWLQMHQDWPQKHQN